MEPYDSGTSVIFYNPGSGDYVVFFAILLAFLLYFLYIEYRSGWHAFEMPSATDSAYSPSQQQDEQEALAEILRDCVGEDWVAQAWRWPERQMVLASRAALDNEVRRVTRLGGNMRLQGIGG
jgi:hypothetical protein